VVLYDTHAAQVYGYVLALLADTAEAEDVVQEVFLRALAQSERWFGLRNPAGYLFRTARNEALSRLRKREVRGRLAPEIARDLLLVESGDGHLERQEEAARVSTALLALPVDQREVVVLKLYQDKTFKQIARLTGVSQNTAASRYRYALAKLREILETEEATIHG